MILMTQISTVQVQRRDAPVTCDACGRRVARKSRQQKFCSDRCRQFAARENKARTAIKNSVLGQDTGRVTNPLKSVSKNNELRGPKSGASIPLNVLGGYRWPNVVGADRELLRKIVRAEIGDTR
jgi:predicted nucleic acid-binding Zn ribbon protein